VNEDNKATSKKENNPSGIFTAMSENFKINV